MSIKAWAFEEEEERQEQELYAKMARPALHLIDQYILTLTAEDTDCMYAYIWRALTTE
jgi:hypothetical protein